MVGREFCRLAEEVGFFGCYSGSWRWGVVSVAPQAERKVLVSFWRFGEGVWRLELACGGLGWKLAGEVIFGQKMGEVFVVVGSGCGEGES